MGQLQVLEFPFVCPAGFLLGTEKDENKPPGLSSSANSLLGDSMREKSNPEPTLPGCDPAACSFPSGHHALSSTYHHSNSHGLTGGQACPGTDLKKPGLLKDRLLPKAGFVFIEFM